MLLVSTMAVGALSFGPRREKTRLRGIANNKEADQPAHTHSLISTFDIYFWRLLYLDLLQAKF